MVKRNYNEDPNLYNKEELPASPFRTDISVILMYY